MTDKGKQKLQELETQKKVIEIADEFIERCRDSQRSAGMTYECVYETDEDGNHVKDENGKDIYRWEDREYTDEEKNDNPDIQARIDAYDVVIKALEKLM